METALCHIVLDDLIGDKFVCPHCKERCPERYDSNGDEVYIGLANDCVVAVYSTLPPVGYSHGMVDLPLFLSGVTQV